MLSGLASWLWMKPKNTDITGWDETREHRYNCLTMCSTCPGSCRPSVITTGQCQTHLQSEIRDIHSLISGCLWGQGYSILHSSAIIMQNRNTFLSFFYLSFAQSILHFPLDKGISNSLLQDMADSLILLDIFSCLNPCCCRSLWNVKNCRYHDNICGREADAILQ